MAGGRSSHRGIERLRASALALVVASSFAAGSAWGFDAFDGRLEAHGAFASQVRAMNADFSEDWDVTQWYNVFTLELEFDLIQDTVGPIDLLSGFIRAEVRYDCVYSRGCGMFRSMNAYGDRSKSLPRRLMPSDKAVRHAGRIRIFNEPSEDLNGNGVLDPGEDLNDNAFLDLGASGRLSGSNTDPFGPGREPTLSLFANAAGADGFTPAQDCVDVDSSDALCGVLAGGSVVSDVWEDNDNPFPAVARAGGYGDFRWAGIGGPWLPKNFFRANALGASSGNPFDSRAGSYAVQASVYNGYVLAANTNAPLFDAAGVPISEMGVPDGGDYRDRVIDAATNGEGLEDLNANSLVDEGGLAATGFGELPYRPVPLFREDGAGMIGQAQNPGDARGLFVPSLPLARALNAGSFSPIENDYNFSQAQRAWNRGASQRDEKELKEAYLDIELFDNRLWLRLGKQHVVWGKTELITSTDQFNPSDAALSSLSSLEESRIAMWSARGVWSFYEVGPIDDVRLELAFMLDDYQQIDIGACGEAYSPNITCTLTNGAFAHGVFGLGLAGVEQPPSPWQSTKGWEIAARLEWRYERFSFALTDFYGYSDTPTIKQFSIYTRNVDPVSGRPREIFGSLPTTRPSVDPYTGAPVANIEQIGTQGICVTGLESACLNPKFDLDGDGLIDGIDTSDGSGLLAINAYEDSNGDGVLQTEDFDRDGHLDVDEDSNENGMLDPGEDVDMDGNLDIDEDSNGNGVLDFLEDVDQDGFLDLGSEIEGLTHSSVAHQIFAYVCATGIGTSALDRSACSLTLVGSQRLLDPTSALPVSLGQGFSALLAGSPLIAELISTGRAAPGAGPVECVAVGSCPTSLTNPESTGSNGGFVFPFVRLNVDPGDLAGNFNPNTNGQSTPCVDPSFNGAPTPCGGQGSGIIPLFFSSSFGGNVVVASTLGGTLSPEQEALLGCGPFWGTQCDDSGIDLLTAEGSALFQSWPGVEGTVQNGDITTLWLTNQQVTSPVTGGQVFAAQPGTRDWYFDRTRSHKIGPVCTTGNFGGQLFEYESDALENDEANGNQAVLPGCRRKWKRSPDDPAFAGDNQVLALNLYGQDLACARERAANGGATVSTGCAGLGAESSPRVDPRSWNTIQDGNPDSLSMQHVQFGNGVVGQGAFPANSIFLPPSRDVGVGLDSRAPDFFYADHPFALNGVFASQAENPALGATFDACDAANYPASVVAEYGGAQFVPCARGGHPMTGQPFASEIAAVSWNFMVALIQLELTPILFERRTAQVEGCAGNAACLAALPSDYDVAREIFMDPGACSFVNPAYCGTFRTLMGAAGLQRNVRKAGGNGVHGRRTFLWQSGGEAVISYEKRNVLGFAMDFAEDRTKSNWGFEFTWIEGEPVGHNLRYNALEKADNFNLTISADRPTFINFLNSNRTFFFNWQFFMNYREGWTKAHGNEGPWDFTTTFAVFTGFFQDRLGPSAVVLYNIPTQSGAFLPSISYRFSDRFSAAVGMAFFFGKPDYVDEGLVNLAPASNRSTSDADHLYKVQREGGIGALVRDRDEIFARVRYTF